MSLLDNIFKKEQCKKNNFCEPSSCTKKIIDQLECKYEYFPASDNDSKLMSAYKEAVKRSKQDHFTPVIIVCSDTLADWICEENNANKEIRRKDILSKVTDGEKYLDNLIAQRRKEYDISDPFEYSDIDGGYAITGFEGYKKYSGGIKETIIAYIPTDKPYEVFAWIPFGGWNECPCAEDMISVSKYWYEKYGAVPSVITSDISEFSVRFLTEDEARIVGIQQYALCPDIVDQGVGELGCLIDTLTKSEIWYFWWD